MANPTWCKTEQGALEDGPSELPGVSLEGRGNAAPRGMIAIAPR